MSTWDPRANDLFLKALELRSPGERQEYLTGACAADAALRAEVESLLEASARAGSFLESPAAGCPSPLGRKGPGVRGGATVDDALNERPGTMIGPYKLLQQIGEGGMGTVYMAEQMQPVQRKVALKVIKPGMDSRQVIARFEAERQALAMMDHVNIARVLDAGTIGLSEPEASAKSAALPFAYASGSDGSGRPYFVMELVHGVPITKYCDDNHLTPRERLELFVPVCQAIQHAHQKGIIHRDIKPSNVMVTLYDGKPVPKVIDFGVAKATEQKLTERTLFTQYGTMVGTLEYMSPEQAEMSALGVDTRSDIYSLGVLLYELLTGSTPLTQKRVREAAYGEVLRMIREEEPPKPSTRLSDSGEALASISAQRKTEPAKLAKLVRGELDWIALKALDKDRNRRYETAKDFAADVKRYLNDEPVQACPPSVGYRLRKLVRRHRGPVLAASLVLLALVVGIIGTTWGMLRANVAQSDAVNEANQKEDALQEKATALTAAQRSKRDADEKLFGSYLAQARAFRMSRRSGQRFESLDVLKRATELARALDLPADQFHELRNAVIASLALPDLHLTGPWNPWPADTYNFDFDEAHALYARTDRQGNCSVRRLADNAELHRLPGLGVPASPLFSRDGQFVAVVHREKEGPGATGVAVHLWALEQPTARLIRLEEKARQVDFHRHGHQVALAYNDGTIGLFELPGGRPIGRPLAPDILTREMNIALHPTEPLVAVYSYFSRVVQIRDVRTGEVVASLPQSGDVTSAAWHPDGQTLAVGHAHPPLTLLYDRTTLQPYRTMEAAAANLSFNPVGDRLAARGWDGTFGLFDVGTGQKLFESGAAAALRFSRDGQRLAGGYQDGKVGFWQVGDGREYRMLVRKALPEKGLYQSVALSPNGRLLACGMLDGFGLWDLASGSELAFMPMDEVRNGVIDVRFEPSGALLTAGYSGLLRWPVRADPKSPDRLLVGPPQRLLPRGNRIGQNRDGSVIVNSIRAVGQWQAYAGGWILHADRPNEPIRLDAGADIGFITVDPEGRWVVTVAFASGLTKIWDASDGVLVKQLTEHNASNSRFSPDGRWLSTNVDGGRLFAVGTWEPGPRVGYYGVFAPDSRLMAIQPTTDVVRLVDRATGRELARLEDPEFRATGSPFFTPDGSKLIGLSTSKGICVWDLRLIRQHLKPMGLDWDYPELPPTDPESRVHRPWRVEVLAGELAKPIPTPKEDVRQAIERYRLLVAAKPDNALACNNLAWAYATAPEPFRDVKAAIPLAEKAVRLEPKNAVYRNTLGVVYYRAERYREAAETLRPNLVKQHDKGLACDLYFLAMSHHRLGDTARAQDYLAWAVRWTNVQGGLEPAQLEELNLFRAEATELLKQEPGAKNPEPEKGKK